MSEPDPVHEDEDQRRRNNLLMLIFAIGLVIAGVWLVNRMIDMRQIQDCVAQGRRNCAPIDVPARER